MLAPFRLPNTPDTFYPAIFCLYHSRHSCDDFADSPEGCPKTRFSALMSSSSSGQWIPRPRPSKRHCDRCAGEAWDKRGFHDNGTETTRPSASDTVSVSSVISSAPYRWSALYGRQRSHSFFPTTCPDFLPPAFRSSVTLPRKILHSKPFVPEQARTLPPHRPSPPAYGLAPIHRLRKNG